MLLVALAVVETWYLFTQTHRISCRADAGHDGPKQYANAGLARVRQLRSGGGAKNTDLAARTVLAARSPVPAACDVWVDAPRWAALHEQRLTSPAFEAALRWTLKVLAGHQRGAGQGCAG